ncbi:MAG: GLUG motif-containing protein, partial [archaeon]
EGDYVLGKDIDFFNPSDWTNPPDGINTTTDNWNSGEGFAPIRGGGKEQFAGSFNGNGFTLTNLYINRPSEDFVGLFGITDAGSIINVRLEDVNIVGGNYVGGLVGANSGTLAISYSTGTVEGAAAVGGLIGKFSNGTIANVYSTANVIVHQDIGGGLIGEIVTGELNNSYSAGEVNGDKATYIGGLIGRNGDGIITNCFWDKDTSKQETSAGSEIGLHTSEMMDSKIFTNWDFKDIWDIVESKTYPFLR